MEGNFEKGLPLHSPHRRKVVDQKDVDALIKKQMNDERGDEIVSLPPSAKKYVRKLKLDGELDQAAQIYIHSGNTEHVLSFSLYRHFLLNGLISLEVGEHLKARNLEDICAHLAELEKRKLGFSKRRKDLEESFYADIFNLQRAIGFRQKITKELEGAFNFRAIFGNKEDHISMLSPQLRIGYHWREQEYDKVEKCILVLMHFDEKERARANNYFLLALAYSEQEKWGKAYEYFMMVLHRAGYERKHKGCFLKNGADESYVRSMEKMLNNLPVHPPYFTEKIRKQQISFLHKEFPELHQDSDKLESQSRQKKLRTHAIIEEKLVRARKAFCNFDQEYMRLLHKASSLPETQMEEVLKPAEIVAAQIQERYQHLKSLKTDIQRPESTISYCDELQGLCMEFKVLTDQILRDINQKKKVAERLLSVTQADSTEFSHGAAPYNIKREYRKKEKEKEITEKKKGINLPPEKKEEEKLERKTVKEEYKEAPITENKIKSFKNTQTENIWNSKESGPYPAKTIALLDSLNKAESMFDLRRLTPPGTKIERLKRDRAGQISIRINEQYRICFRWVSGQGAHDVEVVDYH